MKLYKLLHDQLFNLAQNTNPSLFIFGIGTYPNSPKSNHEDSLIYKTQCNKIDTYRILIDPIYKNDLYHDKDTFKINESIDERNYYLLIDFCNFIADFNCVSIIMEFTGLYRNTIFSNPKFVHITPTYCFGDTTTIAFNPIIEINASKIQFYKPKLHDNLYMELENISFEDNVNIKKLEYIRYLIVLNFLKINKIYRYLLNFMNIKEEFETGYYKTHVNLERSLNKLIYRISGYYKNDAIEVIEDFKKSDYNDLEHFLKDIINNILIDCLYLEKNGIIKEIDLALYINYNNDSELKDIIDHYNKLFENEIKINNMILD